MALIRDPGAGRDPGRDVYVGLGRAELREGRTLDALQAAYRVGARVAWRRVSAAARRQGADPEELGLLDEAIFPTSTSSPPTRSRDTRRPSASRRVSASAAAASCLPCCCAIRLAPTRRSARRLSRRYGGCQERAPLAVAEGDLARVGRRLSADALMASVRGVGSALVSGAAGASRRAELERATGGVTAALGPTVPRAELGESWSIASAALRATGSGRSRAMD